MFKIKDGLSLGANTVIDASGNITVPGKTTLSNTTTTRASLNLGTGGDDPTSPANGDIWNKSGTLKFYGTETKTLAYLDSNISGTAANVSTGIVAILNGGTNTNTSPTAGAVSYGNGTAYAFTAVGTAGQVLTSAAAGAPTWTTSTNANTFSAIVQRDASGNFSAGTITASLSGTATNATNLAVTDDTSTSATYYPSFALVTSGNASHKVSSTKLTFNPSTGLLTATAFAGNGSALTNLDAADISAGTLPIARGGTNGTAAPTAGALAYGSGTAYAFTAAGTAGQVLTSAAAAAPTWVAQNTLSVGSATNATNAANVAITAEAASASDHYLHFGTATTGNDAVKVSSSGIKFQPSTSTLTVAGPLVVGGNLTINGTTNTVNSTTVTIDDPIFTLGGDTAPTVDDNKDRGIEFRWYNTPTLSAKVGFFGFDDSTGKFTFIPDATNTLEVFSGTKGTIDANLEWADVLNKPDPVVTVTLTGDVTGTGSATLTDLTSGSMSFATTIAANSVALGTDTTGNYVASIADGTSGVQSGTSGLTISATAGEGTAATIAHADTSTLTGQQGTAGIANFTIDGLGHITAVTTATYLTAEADTLGTVTSRGASTATASTFSGGLTASGATAITLSNATANVISTGTDVATSIQTRSSSAASTGSLSLFTGDSTFASGTAGSVSLYAGASSSTTTTGSNVSLTGGNTLAPTSTAGYVSIRGGNATTSANTAGTGGNVYVIGGAALAATGAKIGGSLYLEGGGAPTAGGTNTAGTVNIGTGTGIGTFGTVSVNIGKSATTTTTINGTVKLPNVGVAGVVRLGTGGELSADTTVALTTGTLGQFASTTSLQLAGVISDETGTGALVFATSPTLVTPALGTPASGNFSTGTFTWPTFNQNTSGTAAGLSATLVASSGGTGQSSYAVGDILYASTTTALSKLADVATGSALISGGIGVAPSWGKIGLTTHITGTLAIGNGGTGSTTAADARTALGGTTVGANFFTLVNPSAITFPRINLDNTVSTLSAADFRTGLGGTTVGANFFTLVNPSAITFPRINADNSVSTLSAADFRTAIGAGTSSTVGTVTSVSGTAPVSSTGGATPTISMAAATATVDGYMTAAFATKLDGIATGAQVNVATNIAQGTRTATTVPITSSTGTGATLSAATTSLAGVMSSADKTKLDGITAGATAFNPASPGAIGGTTASTGAFTTITATGNITAYSSSDSRLKENIKDIDTPLEKVIAIGGKTYDWTDEYLEQNGGADDYFFRKQDFGVIAQDVEAVFPVAVRTKETGTLAVDYEKLVSLSFAAIKELNAKIESLQAQLNSK